MVVLAFCLEIILFHVYNHHAHLWNRLLDEAISQWEEIDDSEENSGEQLEEDKNDVSVEMTKKTEVIFTYGLQNITILNYLVLST